MTTFLQDIQEILRPASGFANATVEYTRLQGTQTQAGGIECGVFMLGHIQATVYGVAIAFSMKDMTVMRDRILLVLTSKPEAQNPQEDHTTPPVGPSASSGSYPSQLSAIYDPEPNPGFFAAADEPDSPTDEFDAPVLVDPLDVLFDGSRTCPSVRPWRTASVSQPPASWDDKMQQEFWTLLRFLGVRCCSLGVPVDNFGKTEKHEQVRLRRNRGEPVGFVGDHDLTVHTVQVNGQNEVCVHTEGEGEWHVWVARIGQYTMPVWAERALHWLLEHVKTRPQVLSSRRVTSAVPAPASAHGFQSGSSECTQTRRLGAFLADNDLTLTPEWNVDEAVTAQLQKDGVGKCPPARYMKMLTSALANEPVGIPEDAGVTVHTLTIDPDMHVVLASKGCGRRHVWLAQIGDRVTGVWRSKPGDPNAAVEVEPELEAATVAAKARMEDIIGLTTRPYYLTQSTDTPNTQWTTHLVESKLLNAHGRNFELVKDCVCKDELTTIRELVEAIPTEKYVDWLHVNSRVPQRGLVQTLKKCAVQFEGCVEQPAFHGVSEKISEPEKLARKKKVVLAERGSRLGDLLLSLYGRFRKLIPAHMLAKIKNPDKVYLVQINKTTAPQPHHEDERKYDGPGGCIILLYLNLAAMVVFAGHDDEGKAALFHRWIEAGDVYMFCGELRVDLDHGTYPTNGIEKDGRAKSVADASESDIRTVLTYRVGDNASEDETDDDDAVVQQ